MKRAHLRGKVERYQPKDQFATYYQPSEKEIEYFIKKGYDHLFVGHWVTNIDRKDLSECRKCFDSTKVEEFKVDFEIENLAPVVAYELEAFPFFDKGYKLTIHEGSKYVSGRHLRVSLATKCDDSAGDKIYAAAGRIITEIRLRFGLSAASSNSLQCVHNFKVEKVSAVTKGNYIPPELAGEGHDISAIRRFADTNRCSMRYSAETQTLFEAFAEANSSWQRFLFLWLALEANIGNGKAREQFFKQELKSVAANSEVKRLHSVRSAIAHDASLNPGKHDLSSLLFAFRLSVLPESITRQQLLGSYEKFLV